jgi:phosphatidylglycerol lysyltransferase
MSIRAAPGWLPARRSPRRRRWLGSRRRALYHSLSAFAQRGLLVFGLETLLWGPDIVLRGLAFLLLPWSVLLASLDTATWFPAPWVQWAWVAFDLLLAAALFWLSLRFRRWLSRLLLGLVLVDALLTISQAAVFNLPRVHSLAALCGVLMGVLAPSFASLVLANSHRRLSALANSGQI